MGFIDRLQRIDSRIMYFLLAAAIAVPLIWQIRLPMVISPAARGAYATINAVRDDQIAIVSANWAAGTEAENRPQTEILIRHLCRDKKKFATISWDPQGAQFVFQIASRISKEYGLEYGRDWVNWGYRPFQTMLLMTQSMGRDVQGTVKTDYKGTPVSSIPVMESVKTSRNIGAVLEITPSSTLSYWIAFMYGPYRTPIVYAPTSVSGPEGFNYLDSGQIKGMLVGMKGAAEYETILSSPGFATRGAGALSTSHALIILLIILGNIGYLNSRRMRRSEQSRDRR